MKRIQPATNETRTGKSEKNNRENIFPACKREFFILGEAGRNYIVSIAKRKKEKPLPFFQDVEIGWCDEAVQLVAGKQRFIAKREDRKMKKVALRV